MDQINNPVLVQIMVWHHQDLEISHYLNQWWQIYWRIYASLGLKKPLSQPMTLSLLTHICVTRPQWVIALHALLCYNGPCYNSGQSIAPTHDDVIKWKHFPRNWPSVRGFHRSPVNSPHKGQWRGALMFSLICVWINDWVNNREAGDLRRYRAHYDVIVWLINKTTDIYLTASTGCDHINILKQNGSIWKVMMWVVSALFC